MYRGRVRSPGVATTVRSVVGGLTVDFAGDVRRVRDRLTFGRAGDLVLDSDPHLHRLVGEFAREGETWWLRNLGSKLFITLVRPDGTRVELAPGASHVLVTSRGAVRVSVGQARYELRFDTGRVEQQPPPMATAPTGATTEFDTYLTPREVDFLVTFARPIIDGTNGPLPTYADVAHIWGVSPKTLDNTVQTIKRKMRNARLVRDEPLDTIVRVAISHSLVSAADLAWSGLVAGSARSAADGPRFAAPP